MCILFVYTVCILLKVFSYYDLSVMSLSVIGFQKSLDGGGWVGYLNVLTLLSPLIRYLSKILFLNKIIIITSMYTIS